MFFKKILSPSRYTRQSMQKHTFGVEPSKGTLFAERVWFGFMLIFAAPLLLPFFFIALVNKVFSFIFRKNNKKTETTYDFIYNDVSGEDAFISEDELEKIKEDQEIPNIDSAQIDVITDELSEAIDSAHDDVSEIDVDKNKD